MKLIELRKKLGLTQVKFAAKFHIPLSTYTHWEQGRFSPPNYIVDMIAMLIEQEEEQKAKQIPITWIETQIDNLSVKQHCYRQMHQGEEDENINLIGNYMRGLLSDWQEECNN